MPKGRRFATASEVLSIIQGDLWKLRLSIEPKVAEMFVQQVGMTLRSRGVDLDNLIEVEVEEVLETAPAVRFPVVEVVESKAQEEPRWMIRKRAANGEVVWVSELYNQKQTALEAAIREGHGSRIVDLTTEGSDAAAN